MPEAHETPEPPPDATWDAGGLGCGELVLELRDRLRVLPPGGVLLLRAEDPGAPADLPAWCRLTGHTLLSARHPEYRIRRKSDRPVPS
jgi:tRNA 2-thiouridine synthesizing protein A